jgi:eukaryotic-like serine/threonine-protein kinase
MTLTSGTKLGPYEITNAIGAGGMGEVYRARDTRLERTVAIKILPAHLADKPELRERFEREARTIASLNHPHICILHDIGHQDGIDYLVMEYLEGETLAERLKKGQLPLDQVLQYAIEIADALDKAHRKGITHRDLKPGNIMLTKSGTRLLDFGLAKLRRDAASSAPLSQLPTKEAMTAEGTILGTLQYMAPEQLEGKEADARTDIFAFGVVVYEMATGKKTFEGGTSASVMSKILQVDPPPMSSLQPVVPYALDRVVKTCLAKAQENRWQSGADLCRELQWIKESSSQADKATLEAKPAAKGWRKAAASSLVALVLMVIAAVAAWLVKPSVSQPVTRLAITLPASQRLAALDQPAVAISPDGKNTVYVAVQAGNQQLFLRPLDSQEAKPIAGTEGAIDPFFSPDGQWIGFFAGGELKKVSVNGGAAITLASAVGPGGASWGSQGYIALQAAVGAAAGLQQVSQEAGTPQPLTRLGRGDLNQGWPEFLPGGKALLFAHTPSFTVWNGAQISVQPAGTGEPRNLVGGTQPRYAATGHLLFARGGTLMAAPFDLRSLTLTGAAVPALVGVMQSNSTGGAQYSISSTGTLVYVAGGLPSSESRLVWVSRSGEEQPLSAAPHNYQFPRISPDGSRVAVVIAEQEQRIWVYDVSRETLTRLTFEGIANTTPTWSPDGKRIAFGSSQAAGQFNLFWRAADGSGDAERLTTSDYLNTPSSFSPDGQFLAFQDNRPETGRDIWMLRLADHKAQPFLRTPYEDTAPKFSPDGKWLAYSSNESGRREIYVQSYPSPGGKRQISTDGGQEPVWNPNGRELFYRSGSKIMAAQVDTKSGFSLGKPRMLFEGPYVRTSASFAFYDVSPDGQRFLMLKPSEQAQAPAPAQINVVLNWFEELKQKVPTVKK